MIGNLSKGCLKNLMKNMKELEQNGYIVKIRCRYNESWTDIYGDK